jgi:hypothetical protein
MVMPATVPEDSGTSNSSSSAAELRGVPLFALVSAVVILTTAVCWVISDSARSERMAWP